MRLRSHGIPLEILWRFPGDPFKIPWRSLSDSLEIPQISLEILWRSFGDPSGVTSKSLRDPWISRRDHYRCIRGPLEILRDISILSETLRNLQRLREILGDPWRPFETLRDPLEILRDPWRLWRSFRGPYRSLAILLRSLDRILEIP